MLILLQIYAYSTFMQEILIKHLLYIGSWLNTAYVAMNETDMGPAYQAFCNLWKYVSELKVRGQNPTSASDDMSTYALIPTRPLLAVEPQPAHLTLMSLPFLTCKIGILLITGLL